jgi:hypothetical protein
MGEQNDSMPGSETAADTEDHLEPLKHSVAHLQRRLEDQNQRIEALARGREASMATISELRAELALVKAERDQLGKRLTEIESMQTETLTLEDDAQATLSGAAQDAKASIDDLMKDFTGNEELPRPSHATLKVESEPDDATGEYEEMISPELIVLGSSGRRPAGSSDRFLVLLDADKETKCALNEDLLTIGRSDSADIQAEGDFISRIHARILRIGMDSVLEDAGSKNGTRVNGELTKRHVLKHGDLVRVGSAQFRYVDLEALDTDPD